MANDQRPKVTIYMSRKLALNFLDGFFIVRFVRITFEKAGDEKVANCSSPIQH